MKTTTIILICTLFFSCKSSTERKLDEAEKELNAIRIQEQADSAVRAQIKKSAMDTTGLWMAPIIITKAILVKNSSYSEDRDVRLTYKNISGKTIDGIRFKWYGETVFGDPADMGGIDINGYEGFGGGYTEDQILPGKSVTNTWDINSHNAKRIIMAWPTEVAFSDGTKWELKN